MHEAEQMECAAVVGHGTVSLSKNYFTNETVTKEQHSWIICMLLLALESVKCRLIIVGEITTQSKRDNLQFIAESPQLIHNQVR